MISNRSYDGQAARSHGHNLNGDIFNKEMTGMVENYGDLKLYFVGSGEVSEGNTIDNWDGFSKTLVAATCRRNALLVAKLYDQNKALPGTLEWEGQPITMVSFLDPNTGRYL